MKAPVYWWHTRPSAKALFLSPLSLVVGAAATWRMSAWNAKRKSARAEVPVICVGNFVVGGAGKTPVAIALAKLMKAEGFKPVFLTRGYGGQLAGPVLANKQHTAREIGDEAMLLAAAGPTIVARNRVKGAALAAKHGDLIIMDDGFQNPSLHKTVSIVVVDRTVGIGNQMVMPSGPLRAPLRVQARLADLVVVLRSGADTTPHSSLQAVRQIRARSFNGKISLTKRVAKRAKYYAFAGIGRPEKFFDSLTEEGYEIVERWGFDDHYTFTETDARAMLEIAEKKKLRLVTTSKDYVRLQQFTQGALVELTKKTTAMPVECQFENEVGFIAAIHKRLGRHTEI